MRFCDSQLKLNCEAKANFNAKEIWRDSKMMENTTEEKNSLEAKRISAAMWIVDYLECIFHHTLGECKRVIISGLGA